MKPYIKLYIYTSGHGSLRIMLIQTKVQDIRISATISAIKWLGFVYNIPYRRAPRLAYGCAFRPSASREKRYLAYNAGIHS